MDLASAISVSSLVTLLQELVEDNFVDVVVRGELSNVSLPASGHCYFTLKDSKAQLRCAMFRGQLRGIPFRPQEGMAVFCRARVSIYPQRGDLQLIVESMEPEGVGQLQLAFEQLKNKLQQEGLFADERKKELPHFPKIIGIVTSPTGAAIRDMIHVLRRRTAGLHVLLLPVMVQGEGAARQIAAAIDSFNFLPEIDVLIVGRGGGSREDLWAFNEEIVARAIAASKIPVISAVGHEVDFSIADMVADFRAPTPSAAAEIVAKNRLDLERHLDQLELRLATQMKAQLSLMESRLNGLQKRLRPPQETIRLQQQTLAQLSGRLVQAIQNVISEKQVLLSGLARQLDVLSPLAVLGRGYAIVKNEQTQEVLRQASDVEVGDSLQVLLGKGQLKVDVKSKQN